MHYQKLQGKGINMHQEDNPLSPCLHCRGMHDQAGGYAPKRKRVKRVYEQLIQHRIYTDTFKGGEYHLEMTENLSMEGPFDGMDWGNMDLTERRDEQMVSVLKQMWQPCEG